MSDFPIGLNAQINLISRYGGSQPIGSNYTIYPLSGALNWRQYSPINIFRFNALFDLEIQQKLRSFLGDGYSQDEDFVYINKANIPIKNNLSASPSKLFMGLLFLAEKTFSDSRDIKIKYWKDKPDFITDESGVTYKYFAILVEISNSV